MNSSMNLELVASILIGIEAKMAAHIKMLTALNTLNNSVISYSNIFIQNEDRSARNSIVKVRKSAKSNMSKVHFDFEAHDSASLIV